MSVTTHKLVGGREVHYNGFYLLPYTLPLSQTPNHVCSQTNTNKRINKVHNIMYMNTTTSKDSYYCTIMYHAYQNNTPYYKPYKVDPEGKQSTPPSLSLFICLVFLFSQSLPSSVEVPIVWSLWPNCGHTRCCTNRCAGGCHMPWVHRLLRRLS